MASDRDLPPERLSRVLRQVPAFIAVLRGREHILDYMNPAFERLVAGDSALGRPLDEALPAPESEGLRALLDRVHETGEPQEGRGQPFMVASGNGGPAAARLLSFTCLPDRGADGTIAGVIAQGVDVTDLLPPQREAQDGEGDQRSDSPELKALRRKLEVANEQLAAATREAEDARARLHGTDRLRIGAEQDFLIESARIFASSLDYQETLRSVARLAVPWIADWCAVDILEDGVPQRLAVVHVEPEKEKLAQEVGRRRPIDPFARSGVAKVLRTGLPELHSQVTDEELRAAAQDEEHLEILRELGLRSVMIVPMVARGRTLGTITFAAAESGREFGADELRAAEKLASRGGMAIDNALLYRQAERSRQEAEEAQRRAEEARRVAESANRAKSEFLASMSHEMRTPLNAMTGYTELLQMELAGPLTEEQKKQLARVRASTDHLLALINDLLDLARIEIGRLEVSRELASAADATQAALALLTRQAAERGVELTDQCSPAGTGTYVGDRDRVRQILVNLIGNAVKFTDPGGRVTVTCGQHDAAPPPSLASDAGPWTYLRVEDTGIGIAPEEIERIFRPFEQVEAGRTREAGGVGLGLAISRQLALLMGGDLTVESEPGVGSTFTVWLPAEPAADLLEGEAHRVGAGLAEVGNALLARVDDILEGYVTRLRRDPLLPWAASIAEPQLMDHHSTLISEFASALVVLDEGGQNRGQLLQDGKEIQHVVADLHGRQRAQMGWTEEALRREFELWEEELARALEGTAVHEQSEVLERGKVVLGRMIDRALRISLRSFRAATIMRGTPPA